MGPICMPNFMRVLIEGSVGVLDFREMIYVILFQTLNQASVMLIWCICGHFCCTKMSYAA
jgi:hypothetical protein